MSRVMCLLGRRDVIVKKGPAGGVFGILLCGPGSDLLSHVLRRSTIGAGGLNGRVRDGIGWGTPAITTRSAEKKAENVCNIIVWTCVLYTHQHA